MATSASTRPEGRASAAVLEAKEIKKSFGGVRALRGVSLEVQSGEVHGLLGENGSGKSTLIKVLAGYHVPDSGEVRAGGQVIDLSTGGTYSGFQFVHQDLGLASGMSVAENLLIERLIRPSNRLHLSPADLRRQAAEILERYGLALDPRSYVDDLSPLDRAMLAIVRAAQGIEDIDSGAALLVLDEPTVFLPPAEVRRLFDLVGRVVAGGAGVLFVSHDLDEVVRYTDRITVLRDGRNAGSVATQETSVSALTQMIVGREINSVQGRGHASTEVHNTVPVVAVENLATERIRDISVDIRPGEIVGVTGLIGSGVEELAFALFGAGSASRGVLTVGESVLELKTMDPNRAMAAGVALVPGERKIASAAGLNLAENMNLLVLERFRSWFGVNPRQLKANASNLMEQFDIRPRIPVMEYGLFSGGNQQKAVIAKWKQTEPTFLILDEPTQGVDVGAREQIWDIVRNAESTAVLCISTDHEQLAALCDRVLVVNEGRVSAVLEGTKVTKETITATCLNAQIDASEVEREQRG